jgi:hypothetical protein
VPCGHQACYGIETAKTGKRFLLFVSAYPGRYYDDYADRYQVIWPSLAVVRLLTQVHSVDTVISTLSGTVTLTNPFTATETVYE